MNAIIIAASNIQEFIENFVLDRLQVHPTQLSKCIMYDKLASHARGLYKRALYRHNEANFPS